METFASIAANAAVSVTCSWIVAAIYFRKVTPAEKISDQIRHGLQRSLFPMLFPRFFDQETALVVAPEQATPANLDVPHVEYIRIDRSTARGGSIADVLMKVRDLGYDLDVPNGIRVKDHRARPVGVVGLGLGFCRFSIPLDVDMGLKLMRITIELADCGEHTKRRPNTNVQTIVFLVGERHEDG